MSGCCCRSVYSEDVPHLGAPAMKRFGLLMVLHLWILCGFKNLRLASCSSKSTSSSLRGHTTSLFPIHRREPSPQWGESAYGPFLAGSESQREGNRWSCNSLHPS